MATIFLNQRLLPLWLSIMHHKSSDKTPAPTLPTLLPIIIIEAIIIIQITYILILKIMSLTMTVAMLAEAEVTMTTDVTMGFVSPEPEPRRQVETVTESQVDRTRIV